MLSSVLDPLGIVVSIPLVLLLPGAALLAATLPGNRLSLAERLMLSLGLSLSLSVLVGLALNWTVHDFGREHWLVGLGAVTVIALGIALTRSRSQVIKTKRLPQPIDSSRGASIGSETARRWTVTRRDVALLAIAGMLGTSAVLVARLGTRIMPREGYSQLWMLPVEGSADQVQLGIHSFELADQSFLLDVGEGGTILQRWSALTIEMGGIWESTLTLPMRPVRSRVIYARLYLKNQPNEIYRQVTLSISQ